MREFPGARYAGSEARQSSLGNILYFVGLPKDENAKKAPLDEAPRVDEGQQLVGHEDGVDDVDDAVGLEDVRGHDGGHAASGVSEHDLTAGNGGS